MALARNPCLVAQDAPTVAASSETSPLIVGHPFSAIKYMRSMKALPDGKQKFLHNERYPTQIARDVDGRVMMQIVHGDNLPRECDQLDLLDPPVCPSWNVFVIDPVAHTVTHWGEGERAAHVAVDFPLTDARLEQAGDLTSALPGLGPDFTEEDGKVNKMDLGDRAIEGIPARGVRWTLRYDANQDGQTVHRTRIHEVWTSPEMQLIIRVIDGDPNGKETVWGLEKISNAPDAALFRPPDGYDTQHRSLGQFGVEELGLEDFDYLKSWFEK
jgi:hypothetical protein